MSSKSSSARLLKHLKRARFSVPGSPCVLDVLFLAVRFCASCIFLAVRWHLPCLQVSRLVGVWDLQHGRRTYIMSCSFPSCARLYDVVRVSSDWRLQRKIASHIFSGRSLREFMTACFTTVSSRVCARASCALPLHACVSLHNCPFYSLTLFLFAVHWVDVIFSMEPCPPYLRAYLCCVPAHC